MTPSQCESQTEANSIKRKAQMKPVALAAAKSFTRRPMLVALSIARVSVTAPVAVIAFTLACLSPACVTVNVNFPESTVQKETDSYVRDLYRSRTGGSSAKPTPEASPSVSPTGASLYLRSPGNLFFAEAFAQESFKIDSQKSREILDRMRTRVTEIIEFKRQGLLGETTDAAITLRGQKLKPLQAKKLEKLVTEENKDREELYAEIVRSNGADKVQSTVVKKSFSRSFQAESPSGTWVEGADSTWSQKP